MGDTSLLHLDADLNGAVFEQLLTPALEVALRLLDGALDAVGLGQLAFHVLGCARASAVSPPVERDGEGVSHSEHTAIVSSAGSTEVGHGVLQELLHDGG